MLIDQVSFLGVTVVVSIWTLSTAFQQTEPSHNLNNHVHDQRHVMEHMDGVYKKPEEKMSEEELQFHYFKLHDYDNNNQLDGLELASAITHYHKDETDEHAAPPAVMSEHQLTNMLDSILKQEDLNDDGYITYAEFVSAQRNTGSPPPPSQ